MSKSTTPNIRSLKSIMDVLADKLEIYIEITSSFVTKDEVTKTINNIIKNLDEYKTIEQSLDDKASKLNEAKEILAKAASDSEGFFEHFFELKSREEQLNLRFEKLFEEVESQKEETSALINKGHAITPFQRTAEASLSEAQGAIANIASPDEERIAQSNLVTALRDISSFSGELLTHAARAVESLAKAAELREERKKALEEKASLSKEIQEAGTLIDKLSSDMKIKHENLHKAHEEYDIALRHLGVFQERIQNLTNDLENTINHLTAKAKLEDSSAETSHRDVEEVTTAPVVEEAKPSEEVSTNLTGEAIPSEEAA